MVDIESMFKSLRLSWLKIIFGDNLGTWKNYLEYRLKETGGLVLFNSQLFAKGEVNIGEYLPSRRRGKYSPIFTEPEANNCFSIILELNNREIGNQNIFISGST